MEASLTPIPPLHFPLHRTPNPSTRPPTSLFPSGRFLHHSITVPLESSRRNNDLVFDDHAYEAERSRLDFLARNSMEEEMEKVGNEDDSKAWKWAVRKRVWDLMEAHNLAQNPRPVHHRIPNFVGASAAANKLGGLDVFASAGCVKVNPDSPQKQVRFLTLSESKDYATFLDCARWTFTWADGLTLIRKLIW